MKVYLVIGLVVLALCGALWYSIERNMDTSAKLASTAEALSLQEQEATETKDRLTEMTQARDRLAGRLDRIRSNESNLEAALESERAARAQLEKENEAYRNWARTELPDVVVRLLRKGPVHPENGIPGLREREGTGDAGAPPRPVLDESERRPAGSD